MTLLIDEGTVPRKAMATTPEDSVVTKTCTSPFEMTVMSLACPSCAQSGQEVHTEAVGHELSKVSSAYASSERITARNPSSWEKVATVLGLYKVKEKGSDQKLVLLDATSLALR